MSTKKAAPPVSHTGSARESVTDSRIQNISPRGLCQAEVS